MGGQSASTPDQANPWISASSDPRNMPDPLIESLKYAAGAMGYGPNAAPPAAPKMQKPVPTASAPSEDYTIPPDPLIETLKWLMGANNAPKRK